MTTTVDILVDFGLTGLGPVAGGGSGALGYAVYDADGGVLVARTNAGVVEQPAGSGIYHAKVADWDTGWVGRVVWDDGAGHYAAEAFYKVVDQAGGSSPTLQEIVDGVLDEPVAGHLSAGSVGLKLNSAASAGDPWGTSLPGGYTPGTAGYLVGNVGSTVATSLAGAANLVVIGIVSGQVMEVVRGDNYSLADGREWRFTKRAGEPWPADLTGWTITFTANLSPANRATGSQAGQATITLNGVVDVATGESQSIYFEPDASITGVLAIGVGDRGYRWDVQASKGTSRATLRLGVMTVREDQTRT